jgi:amidase
VISDVPTIDDGQWGANARLSPALDFPALTMPAGFTDDSVPVPIEFLGKQFAEPTLFELAYAYEQVAPHRESPEDFGSIEEASTDLSPEAIEAWNEDQRQEITVEATGKGC